MYSRSRSAKPSLLFLTIIASAIFLIPETAYAGNGKFKDGAFDFCVSVRFNATSAQLDQIRNVFQQASFILHDVTDGAHRFGTITVVNNSGAGEAADFWVNPGNDRAYAPGFGVGVRFGVWGQHVMMYYDSNFGDTSLGEGLAYTVVHEFGHLAYALADEYWGPSPFNFFNAECAAPALESSTLNFCIMDNYFNRGGRPANYTLNEFCSLGNHDGPLSDPTFGGNTWQHFFHFKSCWETIATNPKWPIPAKNPPVDPPGLAIVPSSQTGSGDRRFMLLLDRSGSMQSDSKMTIAKIGANQFIQYARDGTNLGIASFADSGGLNFFLTPISESNRSSASSALNAIQPFGGTNIGHGLQIALAELQAQTEPCCTQGIVLISDGDHNTGTHPDAVIPALVNAGVAVFTLGIGTEISASGEATLQNLATQTGGKYFRVSDPSRLLIAIKNILFTEVLGSGPSRQAPIAVTTGQIAEVTVPVEQGAARAAFVVNKVNSADTFTVSLRTPSGQIITQNDGAGGNPNIRHRVDSFARGFQIFNPAPGTWTVIVTAGSITNGNFIVQGFVEHPGTQLNAFVTNELATYPQPFVVTAEATWEGERVVGGSVTGNVIHPQGVSVPITLFDDGNAAHGDFVANDGVFSENFNYVQQFGQHYRNGLPIAGSYTIELTSTVTNGTKFPGEVRLFPGSPPPVQSVPAFTRLASTTAIVANVPADTTVPTCQATNCNTGSPASCDLTVQDTGVGLSLINITATNNVNVTIQSFAPGTTSPVIVTGTLINPNLNGSFDIQSIDVVGNASTCSRTVTSPATLPRILFRTNRHGSFNYELYVMNEDGSNQTRLTNTPVTTGNYQPAWSPTGQKIGFAAELGGLWDIMVMNPDGSSVLNLTQHNAFESYFAFSPDGSKIVFESHRDGPFALWKINADGTGLTKLINNGGPEQTPSWSPNGQKIAFLSYINSVNSKTDVWVMNQDGTGLTNLTQSADQESHPRWSPDGTKIAFARRPSSSSPYDIYVMNADGSGLLRLTTNSTSSAFDWSPDGTKIVFQSNRDGNLEIYVMNANGSSQTRLTNASGSDFQPKWTADGSRILFTSFRTGNSEIFIMNANGTGQVNLTNNAAVDDSPGWKP